MMDGTPTKCKYLLRIHCSTAPRGFEYVEGTFCPGCCRELPLPPCHHLAWTMKCGPSSFPLDQPVRNIEALALSGDGHRLSLILREVHQTGSSVHPQHGYGSAHPTFLRCVTLHRVQEQGERPLKHNCGTFPTPAETSKTQHPRVSQLHDEILGAASAHRQGWIFFPTKNGDFFTLASSC